MRGLLEMSAPPAVKAEGRVHRIDDDLDEEEAMPKGQYDRTKAKARDAAAPGAPASEPVPKKPRKQPPKARAVVPARPPNGEVKRFDVSLDLRGGAVTIHAANGSLTLAPDEVGALFGFMRGR